MIDGVGAGGEPPFSDPPAPFSFIPGPHYSIATSLLVTPSHFSTGVHTMRLIPVWNARWVCSKVAKPTTKRKRFPV
jgi:hypothetical protein